jgi:hypothetical protein
MTKLAPALALAFTLSGCSLTATRVVVVTATPPPATAPPPTSAPQPTPVPPTTAPLAPPAGFALTYADVPTNMQQSISRFHSNAEVAQAYGLDATDLQRRGRITSYESEFSARAASGMLEVDDVVAAWKTLAGARWDYARVLQAAEHPNFQLLDVHTVPASGLGDQESSFSFRRSGQSYNVRDYAIMFTRGRYRVFLQVATVHGTVSDADVIHLARLIDGRIKSAP